MEMESDENHDNRRRFCKFPCSRCSSCRCSFSWNDSNLFFTLQRFFNVICSRKRRRRREKDYKKDLSDLCALVLKTFNTYCMSLFQKMKVSIHQVRGHHSIKNQPSSNVPYIFFLLLLFSHQIRYVIIYISRYFIFYFHGDSISISIIIIHLGISSSYVKLRQSIRYALLKKFFLSTIQIVLSTNSLKDPNNFSNGI